MDVICLGILVADVFAEPIDALPKAGELKTTDRFLLSSGGCAANTAACLRRLGRSVTVLGKVGNDLFGDFVVADLSRQGIGVSHVKRSSAYPTSGTVIINVHGEDRRYLHCLGANSDLTLADVNRSVLDDARVLAGFRGGCSRRTVSGCQAQIDSHRFRCSHSSGSSVMHGPDRADSALYRFLFA